MMAPQYKTITLDDLPLVRLARGVGIIIIFWSIYEVKQTYETDTFPLYIWICGCQVKFLIL